MRDIANSYEWGSRELGDATARRWYLELRSHTRNILMLLPLGQPLASESDKAGREIHQLIFDRYRILFDVVDRNVRVLHVRGAFIDTENKNLGVDK